MAKTNRKFKHLTLIDRIKIDLMNRKGHSKREIAEEIGCSIRTVFYELKRCVYEHLRYDLEIEIRYNPYGAEQRYRDNLKCKGRASILKEESEYKNFIADMLIKEKLSPENIIYLIENIGKEFDVVLKSKTSIYNAIKKGYFKNISMKNLVCGKKDKAKDDKLVIHRELRGLSIDDRPAYIDLREEFGHWEMDCLVGQMGCKTCILVLTERKTRFQEIEILKEQTQDEVIKALDRIEARYKEDFYKVFKTVTVDNGSEFLDCKGMQKSKLKDGNRFIVYYCHPAKPNQRGSNENANKHLRRFYAKGSDFSKYVNNEYLDRSRYWINYIFHRGILKGQCSGKVFEVECRHLSIKHFEYIYDTS